MIKKLILRYPIVNKTFENSFTSKIVKNIQPKTFAQRFAVEKYFEKVKVFEASEIEKNELVMGF